MTILNADRPQAAEISRWLRQGQGGSARRRRGIVGLSLLAAASMGVISLYQTGLIRHIPEPRWKGLDADKVDASPAAYRKFSSPDALIGLGSYSATATLAAMGGNDPKLRRPWVSYALAAKIGFDVTQGLILTRDQWVKHRSFCSWCLLATAATLATVPLVVPETLAALGNQRGAFKQVDQVVHPS